MPRYQHTIYHTFEIADIRSADKWSVHRSRKGGRDLPLLDAAAAKWALT
jgi:hypothetical protein